MAHPILAMLAAAAVGLSPALTSPPVGATGATGLRAPGDSRGSQPRGGWRWPLAPRPQVVRAFEPPPAPWASGHRGVDLLGADGQAVLAAGPGTVSWSGVIAERGVVTVRHAGGWRTTYEPVTDRATVGTRVGAGDPLGTLASTASHCVPRVCLHWGAITGKRDYHDPLALLGLVPPVLLPVAGS